MDKINLKTVLDKIENGDDNCDSNRMIPQKRVSGIAAVNRAIKSVVSREKIAHRCCKVDKQYYGI